MKRKILFSFLPVTPQVKLRPVALDRLDVFRRILAVPKSAAFCSNSTLTDVPISLRCFSNAFGIVPSAPTTTGTTFTLTCHNLQSSLTKSWYFYTFIILVFIYYFYYHPAQLLSIKTHTCFSC